MDDSDSTTEVKFETCPCCGKPTLAKPLKPGKLLMDQWLACLVSGVPFVHTYEMYDGKISLSITLPTADQTTRLTEALSVLEHLQTAYSAELASIDFLALRRGLILFLGFQEITVKTDNVSKTYVPEKIAEGCIADAAALRSVSDAEELKTKLTTMQQTLLSEQLVSALPLPLLVAAMETHKKLNALMVDAGFSEGFWTGIELA